MANQLSFRRVIQTKLLEYLYTKAHNHLSAQILEIAEHNQALNSSTVLEFVYRGESFLRAKGRNYVRPNELHTSLRASMDQILKRREDIMVERGYVVSYITKVLNSSHNMSDYLGMFPESLHEPIYAACAPDIPKKAEVSPEVLSDVMKYNSRGFELVKQRLLQNLLM